MAKRDFTDVMLRKIINLIDEYFDDEEEIQFIARAWDRLCNFFAGKGVEKYVISISSQRDKTERTIRTLWENVFAVEDEYTAKFEKIDALSQSYKKAIDAVSECINVGVLCGSSNFAGRLKAVDECNDLNIENRARDICKKYEKQNNRCELNPDNMTDEEIEILSYAYVSTTDNQLKSEILDVFYVESDEPVDGFGSMDKYAIKDEHSVRYIRSKRYEDFAACTDYYLGSKYKEYLLGNLSDAEINIILNNHRELHEISNVKDIVSDGELFQTDEDGKLFYNVRQPYLGGATAVNKPKKVTLSGYDWIDNGSAAAQRIDDNVANSMTTDYDQKLNKIVLGYSENAFTAVVPGGGAALKIAKKIQKNLETISPTDTSYKDVYNENYVEVFDIKCMNDSGDYKFLPTADTVEKIDKFFEWIGNNCEQGSLMYEDYHYDESSGLTKYEYFMSFDSEEVVTILRGNEELYDYITK